MKERLEDRFPGLATVPAGSVSDARSYRSRDRRLHQHDHRPRLNYTQRSDPLNNGRVMHPHTYERQSQRTGEIFVPTCEGIGDETKSPTSAVLRWPMDPYSTPVPSQAESNILSVLMQWGHTERGMILSQPPFRLSMIREACRNNNIQLIQALSFRRSYMKYLNPSKSMEELRLGEISQIRKAATLFEQAVAAFMTEQGIQFCTEEEQRRTFLLDQDEKSKGKTDDNTETRLSFTPDFIFNPPISLCKCTSRFQQQGRTIHWLEAKMFYGASTIPQGTKNAVGGVIEKAKKYVQHFGPGAIVFAYGCGEVLTRDLENMGVQVLDAYPLDLSALREYQKKWCCSGKGEVLF